MKTLAILDSDSLDLALGGVGRAMPGQSLAPQSGGFLGISKFADSFGFPMPAETSANIDAVLSSFGAEAGADAGADGGWCGNHTGAGTGGGMGPGASDGSGGGGADGSI